MAMRTGEVDTGSLTDSELARRAGTGDTEAFEALYRRHAEAAWRVGQAVTGNADDAADAVSEASIWLGGPRLSELSRRLWRPLATVATGVLAIGVISAALMGEGGVPGPVAAGRPSPLPPTAGATVSPFAPAAAVTPLNAVVDGAGLLSGDQVAVTAAGPGSPSQPGPSSQPTASSPPTASSHPGGAAQTSPAPVAQVSATVNVGTTASVAVGVGSGSCTGISAAGGTSCAPPATPWPGVSLTAVTPLGTITTPSATASATLPPTRTPTKTSGLPLA